MGSPERGWRSGGCRKATDDHSVLNPSVLAMGRDFGVLA